MADQSTITKSRRGCWCNHCEHKFKRTDLDGHFLCAECRTIPGVQGYQDPRTRGIRGGSPAYWDRTKGQLNVITDDATAASLAPAGKRLRVETWHDASDESAVTVAIEPMPVPDGTLAQWQCDVLAARELSGEAKVLLIRLSFWADYVTGGNCRPSEQELAKALGRSRTLVRRIIKEVGGAWVEVYPVEMWRHGAVRRVANLHRLRWPDGRRLALADDKRAD